MYKKNSGHINEKENIESQEMSYKCFCFVPPPPLLSFFFFSEKKKIYYDGGREQFRPSAAGPSVLLGCVPSLAYKNIIKIPSAPPLILC